MPNMPGQKPEDRSFDPASDPRTRARAIPASDPLNVNVHGPSGARYLTYTAADYIQIKLQTGPILEVGVNGCQIDDVIEWAHSKLVEFNQPPYYTPWTRLAIEDLADALTHLAARTADRVERGVEGTSKP